MWINHAQTEQAASALGYNDVCINTVSQSIVSTCLCCRFSAEGLFLSVFNGSVEAVALGAGDVMLFLAKGKFLILCENPPFHVCHHFSTGQPEQEAKVSCCRLQHNLAANKTLYPNFWPRMWEVRKFQAKTKPPTGHNYYTTTTPEIKHITRKGRVSYFFHGVLGELDSGPE